MESRIKVAVVDDHPMFREGVIYTLSTNDKFEVVGEGASADDALRLVSDFEPDVLLLDLKLPGGGLEAANAIISARSRTHVLMLTAVDDQDCIESAFRGGVRGYLLKGVGSKELVETVSSVARGDLCISPQLMGKLLNRMKDGDDKPTSEASPAFDFTDREEQVLSLLSQGLSNKQIAFRLTLSEKTVKYYLTHVLRKLNVRNRVEAALYASHRITPPGPITGA